MVHVFDVDTRHKVYVIYDNFNLHIFDISIMIYLHIRLIHVNGRV